MKRLLIIFATLIPLHSSSAAQPVTDRRTPSITVSGEAIITAEPDQAEIDIGVVTQAKTALEASKENAERVARVLGEVKKLLGKGDEAKTSGYTLNPQYRYPKDGKPEIIGYVASNVVRIKIARIDEVGRLIDAAMQAGANNINRLAFTLRDEESTRLEALRGQPGFEPARMAQEAALMADRLDVSEELLRLDTHLAHAGELVAAAGAVGRKLDFVIQEIGRELNTIASKAQDAGVAGLVIDAKAELERMREQAQNVE